MTDESARKFAVDSGIQIGNLRGERDRYKAALVDIEAAALRNNGPLARDRCEDQMRGIGLKAQNALLIEASLSSPNHAKP